MLTDVADNTKLGSRERVRAKEAKIQASHTAAAPKEGSTDTPAEEGGGGRNDGSENNDGEVISDQQYEEKSEEGNECIIATLCCTFSILRCLPSFHYTEEQPHRIQDDTISDAVTEEAEHPQTTTTSPAEERGEGGGCGEENGEDGLTLDTQD